MFMIFHSRVQRTHCSNPFVSLLFRFMVFFFTKDFRSTIKRKHNSKESKIAFSHGFDSRRVRTEEKSKSDFGLWKIQSLNFTNHRPSSQPTTEPEFPHVITYPSSIRYHAGDNVISSFNTVRAEL